MTSIPDTDGHWCWLANAYRAPTWADLTPLEGYVGPGVAEALILAGQVEVEPDSGLTGPWTEVDPCL